MKYVIIVMASFILFIAIMLVGALVLHKDANKTCLIALIPMGVAIVVMRIMLHVDAKQRDKALKRVGLD